MFGRKFLLFGLSACVAGSALAKPPPKAKPEEVASELSERLVTAVSILILPFLAIPFAVGNAGGDGA